MGTVAVDANPPDDLFFAKQVIQNACATQAVLSVLLNAPTEVELGETLENFRDFTQEFDPEMRGVVLSNSDVIRNAHNTFARPEPIVLQSAPANKDDDVFHFIAYVPRGGKVFELDGLKSGPINHGAFTDNEWLDVAVPAIQQRIAAYSTSEIKFNLMAVTRDRRVSLRERLTELQSLENSVECEDEIQALTSQLELEESKELEWRDENIRRRHNYIPFVFNLLTAMAEKGQLSVARDKAKTSSRMN